MKTAFVTMDDCVGAYDDCGVCNGPGAIHDCDCSDIPEATGARQPARRVGVWRVTASPPANATALERMTTAAFAAAL